MTVIKSRHTIDEAALMVAQVWARARSKDPTTKVGACIVDPRTGALHLGYNGLPAGVPDEEKTWVRRTENAAAYELTKYDLVIHAEVNAARKALLAGADLTQATLVCTHLPCPDCMKNVVLANGIRRVVFSDATYNSLTPRNSWLVTELAKLGKVEMIQHTFEESAK